MSKKQRRRRRVARSNCMVVNPPSQTIVPSPTEEVYDGLLYAGESHNCVKIPATKPILMIDSGTFGVLRCLADKYPNSEWGVYLIGEIDKDGDGICSSHLIPKQHTTGGSVLPDSDVDNVVCWLHSHHGMGAWHSGTDRQYANYPFIATVSLQQGKFDISAKKRFLFPCCNKYILVDTDIQFYFTNEEEEITAETNILRQKAPQTVIDYPSIAATDVDWEQISGSGYVSHGNIVPANSKKYHPIGTKCEFGLEENGCKWVCHFAVKNYYKDGKQQIFCDRERAQARTSHPIAQQGRFLGSPQPMNARESETESKRFDKYPDRPVADATKNRDGLAIVSLGINWVVAVDEGTPCPVMGHACTVTCRNAISITPMCNSKRMVLCVKNAEERRTAALATFHENTTKEVDDIPD